MRLSVTVKPRSKTASVERIDETHVVVRVKEPAHEGKANRAVIKALAAYFNVPASMVSLLRGTSSKQKVVEIT